MVIQFDPAYRKYWTKIAKYRGSTCTYTLFTARLESDHVYKRNVDTYISMCLTEVQRQQQLEGQLHYG
jgi:hypothetical protein